MDRNTPSANQVLLDFASRDAERIAQIRSLERITLLDESGDVLPYGRKLNVVEVLERITLLCSDGVTGDICLSAIAARISRRKSVSERTARRWAGDAQATGLLDCWMRSRDFGGSNWNRYTIRFDRIVELLSGTPTSPTVPAEIAHSASPPPGRRADRAGQGRTRADTVSALGGQNVRPKYGRELRKKEIPPPPPPPHVREASVASDGEWAVVVDLLRQQGVAEAAKSAMAARANGCTPDHIRDLIGAFQDRVRAVPASFGPEALYWRVKLAAPALGVAAGWPPPKASAVAVQAQQAKSVRNDALARSTLKRKILLRARELGLTDEQIGLELHAHGLSWDD